MASKKKKPAPKRKRSPKKKKVELEPPDRLRCQALIPNGHTFMTLGGRPGFDRCAEEPAVIIQETEPAGDGQVGSMSLCPACLAKFEEQCPDKKVKIVQMQLMVDKLVGHFWCRTCAEVHYNPKPDFQCNEEVWEPLYVNADMLARYYPEGI